MKVISLKCVNCGATLDIGPGVDNFACSYCGTQQHVERSGGIVSLRRIETALSGVQQATDRTASELALVRLKQEMTSIRIEVETKVKALREADEKENVAIGFGLLIGSVASLVAFGWWGIAVILVGLVLGFKVITPLSAKIAPIERNAATRLAELNNQIQKHQAIVDGLGQ